MCLKMKEIKNVKKKEEKMGYYKKEFDKRGFDTMWTFLQMGHQKTNIPQLKKQYKI